MADYRTPGVYIEEKNAFPGSAVAVETSVPVFIGYTEKAEKNGKNLIGVPTRITSFAEYNQIFGMEFQHKFTIAPATGNDTFMINGVSNSVKPKNSFYLYNSMRLFYSNGGSNCYILSVGTYGVTPSAAAPATTETVAADAKAPAKPAAAKAAAGKSDDTTAAAAVTKVDGTKLKDASVWAALEKEMEPTLVLIPDACGIDPADDADGAIFYGIYTSVLAHCQKMQSRFGIFDVPQTTGEALTDANAFRDKIGINFLNYGAAYYPWLKTGVVAPSEVSFLNLDTTVDLGAALPEPMAKDIVNSTKINPSKIPAPVAPAKAFSADDIKAQNTLFHQALLASSPTYVSIMNEIKAQLNRLPPSAAMAGVYTMIDTTRGVWKAPANVSVNMVSSPYINITSEQQENLNVDAMSGKSINAIRPFPGIGTLVWGARTLDGNSQDWRYINVRRTLIMIEQSLKLAIRAYVFEPNTASTWITVQSMITNFLTNLWKQGALAGAAPEQAFSVQVGLGVTMTPVDILDGKMLITIMVAIARPAEFIVLTFQQQQQQS